jgi:hypothetical protein
VVLATSSIILAMSSSVLVSSAVLALDVAIAKHCLQILHT